jgi:hypothetical protein
VVILAAGPGRQFHNTGWSWKEMVATCPSGDIASRRPQGGQRWAGPVGDIPMVSVSMSADGAD